MKIISLFPKLTLPITQLTDDSVAIATLEGWISARILYKCHDLYINAENQSVSSWENIFISISSTNLKIKYNFILTVITFK